ncbi:GDNF-inducible zinc finger protein 1-like [Trichogramma pretiosum]|uniref:GDNF-inducible zinc finger protein 1-like n=1 Tax=Trichogramma pretiosum TaxID=7493 RepID=UPI0006C9B7DE|nr:GDNF-inducible zinc finger protein 1-like [Trichogramma pretiosum]
MELSKMFSCVVKVKKEPIGSLMENEYGIIDKTLDVKSARFFRCPQDNLIHMLQKSDENHQGNLDEVKIEFECKDMKPDVNLLVVTKIEDCLQNNFQDLKNSNIDQVQNKIKVETLGAVKKESIVDGAKKLNMDFDCGLSEPREENSVTKELTDNYRLETQIITTRSGTGIACDACGKSYTWNKSLKKHIDSVHNKIAHACDTCGKKFTTKSSLKIHIDSVHHKVTHACDICEKSFTDKSNLKKHIDSAHIRYTMVSNIHVIYAEKCLIKRVFSKDM